MSSVKKTCVRISRKKIVGVLYLERHNHLTKSLGFLPSQWNLEMNIREITNQSDNLSEIPNIRKKKEKTHMQVNNIQNIQEAKEVGKRNPNVP